MLLFEEDFISEDTVELKDRRHRHVLEVHKAEVGKELRVGILNGKMGKGLVTSIDSERMQMKVQLDEDPPEPSNIQIVMAMPRPKVLKRIIQDLTTMGVKKIWIIKTWKVEKSFWKSPVLLDESLFETAVLGLEQAKDTVLPEIKVFKGFKPFVEDEIPDLIRGTQAIVAHPHSEEESIGIDRTKPVTLAIGPEGGFIDYEIDMFKKQGFSDFSLGKRILRVETVLPYLIGKLS